MPCLTTCCCGFSVKAGTRAIAILSVVYSLLGLLMVGTFNMEKDRLFERQLSSWPSNSNPSFHGVVNPNMNENMLQQSEPPWPEDDIEAMSKEDLSKYEKRRRLEILMSFYAISVSVNFVVSLSLLAGVKLERRWLLLPWVGWNSLTLVTNQMAVFLAPNKQVSTIPDIFTTGINIYCIMCVYSYFQTLSESPPNHSHSSLRQTSQATWTGTLSPGTVHQLTCMSPPVPPLSPRSPLTVNMPPDLPPAYQSPDNPPCYDPPPPYPGSPKDKKETLESQLNKDDQSIAIEIQESTSTSTPEQPQVQQNESTDKNEP